MNSLYAGHEPQVVGPRIRAARVLKRITQDELASMIGVARTTLISIESGKRPVRPEELEKIAASLDTTINRLLRKQGGAGDLALQFRSTSKTENPELQEAIARRLQDLADSYVSMENLLGKPLVPNYPPIFRLGSDNIPMQASDLAALIRNRLGLGNAPVINPLELIELNFGLRIFIRSLGAGVAGAYAFDGSAGACIIINANHPRQRRKWTLLHEVGHFLTERLGANISFVERERNSRMERFVDNFAGAFLMPSSEVRMRVIAADEHGEGISPFQIFAIAEYFGVSFEAACRRMEGLGHLDDGTFEMLVERGLKVAELRRLTGLVDSYGQEYSDHLTTRSTAIALEAHSKGHVSESQLAEFLGQPMIAIRQLVAAFGLA